MHGLEFDVAHLLAGSLVLASFMLLYQDRLYALLNVYALHAFVLALSVAWQAFVQHAPHLYLTAAIALVFKAIIIPVALHRIIVRLGIHREIETALSVGLTMIGGIALQRLPLVGNFIDAHFPRWLLDGLGVNFYFGGTSLLIVVGVAMDTVNQIEAQLIMRHYEGFTPRAGRIRGRRSTF